METIIDRSALEELRASLRGAAHAPGEEGYDEAREAWNPNAHQHPALVVMAADAAQVFGPAGLRHVRKQIGWLETALSGLPDGRPCPSLRCNHLCTLLYKQKEP